MLYNWFLNIEFAYPWVLYLLVIVPLLIVWYLFSASSRQASITISSLTQLPDRRTFRELFRHVPFIFRLLALTCIILALARPRIHNNEELISGEGVDIVLCIDVSGSMLAQDLQPNRLEAAKEVAANFVSNRPTDRIGLVVFAGESFTQAPLTTDQKVLRSQIYGIQSDLLEDGTAIGMGLATGVERLKESSAASKVVILLTDGENNRGFIDPNTAKELAKSLHVKVYTIGVGAEGLASVPVKTDFGVVLQKQKVNIDEDLLKQIAGETGGKYFRAKNNMDLSNIYTEIDKLEKSKLEIHVLHRYTEKFFPLALAAIVLLLLEAVLKFSVFKKFP